MRLAAKLFIAALLATALMQPVAARADLTITPKRVVFEARDRSATIQLLNLTDHTNTYRFTWLNMKAQPTGGYATLPPPDAKDPFSVANMVIFTPRQVTIEPHGHQVVRLSLRRPADLPPGEYRAHMAMTRLANNDPPKQDPDAKDVDLALNVNIGFSIPVIVRSGEDKDLHVSLTSPQLALGPDKKTPMLNVSVHRDAGKFSTYGFIKISWQPVKGPEKIIGGLNNVALYPELQQRDLSIPLKESPDSGTLKIAYLGQYESDGKTWAETSVPISR